MRAPALALVAFMALSIAPHAQTRIDSINTNFRWLGPDDKIVVERYDDPKVANLSCYMSRAETGGITGAVGIAEDPSRFSIACRAVGPIDLPPRLPKSEVIGFASASLFFKTFQILRGCRKERAGVHRRQHEAHQWFSVQQHQRGAIWAAMSFSWP